MTINNNLPLPAQGLDIKLGEELRSLPTLLKRDNTCRAAIKRQGPGISPSHYDGTWPPATLNIK